MVFVVFLGNDSKYLSKGDYIVLSRLRSREFMMGHKPLMNRYSQIKEIGRGSSSTVWLVRDTTTDQLVAMKKCHLSYYRNISKSTDDIFEMACREVEAFLFFQFRHAC